MGNKHNKIKTTVPKGEGEIMVQEEAKYFDDNLFIAAVVPEMNKPGEWNGDFARGRVGEITRALKLYWWAVMAH